MRIGVSSVKADALQGRGDESEVALVREFYSEQVGVARICKAAIGLCAKQGVKVGLFRPITAWPFPEKQLAKAMAQDSVKKAIAVEISAGQMLEDVKLTVNGTKPVEFYGKPGSYTPTAEEIAEYIMKSREA